MKKYLVLTLCFMNNVVFAQQQERPKIGIALSGGGAKGLAHIGLLQAIDSAGLDVEYVAGTSMGAIIGGLYAVGYTGKQIEKITRQIDWDKILTNRSSYDQLILPKKNEKGKFLEIPLIDGKLAFRRGALESNELWLTLNQLFFPYLTTTRFDQFKREFHCIAANVENGNVVVLKEGNIVKALRASMAIPVAFTPVEINGITLVDGGIAMNFPVSEAKKMGADWVIGSSVLSPPRRGKEIKNPLQMVVQLSFYKERKDFEQQMKATDIFVDYPIEEYTTSSFSSAEDIIKIGIERGRELYPVLKKLKDSLDNLYGKKEQMAPVKEKTPDKLFVHQFTTRGVSAREADLYLRLLNFKNNKSYSAEDLSGGIRKVFGSGTFRKINYEVLTTDKNDSVTVLVDFEKEPHNLIKTALNYNSDTRIALILGFSMLGRNNPFSETSAEVAIGENPQFNVRNQYFFRRNKTWYIEPSIRGEYYDMPVYNVHLEKTGLYNYGHSAAEVKVNNLITSGLAIGVGTRFDHLGYSSEIKIYPRAKGKINFFTTFFDLHLNSLDQPFYPNKGNVVDLEAGVNFNQRPHYISYDGTSEAIHDFQPTEKKSYFTLKYNAAHYFPVQEHSVFIKVYSGMHFGKKQDYFNDFVIGGNNPIIRNQILLPGFRAGSIYSSSVIAPQVGFQYSVSKRFVATAMASYLKYDFIKSNKSWDSDGHQDFIFGLGLSAGYKSLIGPLEASLMYNNVNNSFYPVFNIGYSLNF